MDGKDPVLMDAKKLQTQGRSFTEIQFFCIININLVYIYFAQEVTKEKEDTYLLNRVKNYTDSYYANIVSSFK